MYHCIINPAAGRGRGQKLIPVIKSILKDVEINMTNSNTDAAKLAKEACAAGSNGIVGVGGDGTMQDIVTGMLDGRDSCDVPFGIISCGSGNDLKRTFCKTDNVENCLHSMLIGKVQVIDAIRANDAACVNIANIGLDAKIVRNARFLKKIFGKSSYIISTVASVLNHKNTFMSVHIDGKEHLEGEFTLVAVCNGQYYGGGMRITPSALMDDGRITLCLINAMSGLKALTLFPVMLLGRHTGLKAIQYIECKQVTLTIKTPQTLCLDGNLYECPYACDFKILPEAIRVVV